MSHQTIRQAYIDAVWGRDFLSTHPTDTPPLQGWGEIGTQLRQSLNHENDIPYHFVTYQVSLPKNEQRVGLTLSKLALGLYVYEVAPYSEAQAAGVLPESILVSVNETLHVWGEPSRYCLERLWQYEGLFESLNSTKEEATRAPPLALTLYHVATQSLYTCILLTSPFGIEWKPCGNFCHVARSFSKARQAGIVKGSLLVGLQEGQNVSHTLRTLEDHVDWGVQLQQMASSGSSSAPNTLTKEEDNHEDKTPDCMELVLAFAPAASRPGFYERQSAAQHNHPKAPTPLKKSQLPGTKTDDGIQVRVHPIESSVRTFLSSSNSGATTTNSPSSASQATKSSEDPSSISALARQVVAGNIIRAPTKRSITTQRHQNDATYGPPPAFSNVCHVWSGLEALVYCLRFHQASYQDGVGPAVSSLTLCEVLQQSVARESFRPFLLQCISILCADEAKSTYGNVLISILLTISRGDADFCQRLYFLLRSFSGSLESQQVELICSAQEQLTRQLQNDSTLVPVSSPRLDASSANHPSPPASPPAVESKEISTTDGPLTQFPVQAATSPMKKKSVMRMFRKKKSSRSQTGKGPKTPPKEPPVAVVASSPIRPIPAPLSSPAVQTEFYPMPTLLENTTQFFGELDKICETIEGSLFKSFRQRIADWALQPWSASKETALAKVTEGMRDGLASKLSVGMPLVNPIDSSEVLVSVDPEECYILPSAHFPLLLTLNVDKKSVGPPDAASSSLQQNSVLSEEQRYRTRIEFLGLCGKAVSPARVSRDGETSQSSYFVHAAVAGTVKESGRSVARSERPLAHLWERGNVLTFDTRSSWGAPQTLSLRLASATLNEDGQEQVASTDEKGMLHYSSDRGCCWIDLKPMWSRVNPSCKSTTVLCHAQVSSVGPGLDESFSSGNDERFELEIRVTTELLGFASGSPRKRMLLYKHDDDLRQELFAIDFINTCDSLLKASGLDLKLLTFRCTPVGAKRGFIEWVPGSVPLSDLCKPGGSSLLSDTNKDQLSKQQPNGGKGEDDFSDGEQRSQLARAGLVKYQFPRNDTKPKTNPIQDFFISVAYDADAPYMIRKETLDTYIKSCAGYCVLTYILGVGDRHLDNLLLHPTGHFFHCDFTFLLGRDPKKYLPLRITETMIEGMGGTESDGYAMFLSLAGAAFCALRRCENVRVLLSLIRLMAPACLPDFVSLSVDEAVLSVRERLRLELSDREAIAFMENLIESSVSNKLWMAVDAIHSLGKHF